MHWKALRLQAFCEFLTCSWIGRRIGVGRVEGALPVCLIDVDIMFAPVASVVHGASLFVFSDSVPLLILFVGCFMRSATRSWLALCCRRSHVDLACCVAVCAMSERGSALLLRTKSSCLLCFVVLFFFEERDCQYPLVPHCPVSEPQFFCVPSACRPMYLESMVRWSHTSFTPSCGSFTLTWTLKFPNKSDVWFRDAVVSCSSEKLLRVFVAGHFVWAAD